MIPDYRLEDDRCNKCYNYPCICETEEPDWDLELKDRKIYN